MKRKLLILILAMLLLAAAVIGILQLNRGQKLYVLMYHSVAPDGTNCGDWTVTQSKFREQMRWLKDHGYTTVLPSELAAGKELPQKAVMITFDDGYTDNYTLALPVLQEFEHKAVVSIVTSYIGVEKDFMDWDMCRKLQQSGLVEIGSHTHNLHRHPGLQRRDGETREEYEKRAFPDILQSISLIEEQLGAKPVFLAFPHGIEDPWISAFAREQFAVTVVTDAGVNRTGKGLHSLLRYNINDRSQLEKYLP